MAEITHNSIGRINVTRGDQVITLRLFQWSVGPEAVLSHSEARNLIERLQAALAPAKTRATTAPVVEDDYSDIA